MGLLVSIVFGVVPMVIFAGFVYWLDRFEKEPKILLFTSFIWGGVIAAGLAFAINSMVGSSIYLATGSSDATQATTGSLVAPVVEESLKGLGVFAVAYLFKDYFDSILDGIVYAGVVALGFAATENIYYIYNFGFLHHGFSGLFYLTFVRDIVVGWQHPFFTAFIGIGLATARLSLNQLVRFFAPLGGWVAAILAHSLHNTLSDLFVAPNQAIYSSLFDWIGWILMFAFILYSLRREQRWVSRELSGEVALGIISHKQLLVAASPIGQMKARWESLRHGSFQETNRFYQLCGVLAHKKHLRNHLGEENGNTARISDIRTELVNLSPCVVVVEP